MFGLPLMFYTVLGATFAANMTFAGYVGIGAAPSGGALHITEDSSVVDSIKFQDTRVGHTRSWLMGPGTGVADTFGLRDSTGGVNVMNVSYGGAVTWSVGAQASAAETLATWKITDDTAKVELTNNSATDATFIPQWKMTTTGANLGGAYYNVIGTDSGTNPAMTLGVGLTATRLSTRPLLNFLNYDTYVFSLIPLNSGNQSCISFKTPAAGNIPTFTTRSTGTRIILYEQLNGTNVDYAIGLNSTGRIWFSVASTGAGLGFDWYAGQTKILGLDGDTGIMTLTSPAASAGYIASFTRNSKGFGVYSDTASIQIGTTTNHSLCFTINAGGNLVTLSSTAFTSTLPIGVPSYTVAGVPSAAVAAQIIYVSNEVGGAVLAFSDGTNWRRVTDRAIIS